MNDYRPNNPPDNQAAPQDELDRALDAMVRGDDRGVNRLDAGMQTTISHLYALADLSQSFSHSADIPATREGVQRPLPRAVKPSSTDRERAPSKTPVLLRPTNANKRRSIFMSTLSGLAAALLIGLGIYAAIPVFSPDDAAEPTSIAFVADNESPTVALASGGGGDSLPQSPATGQSDTNTYPPLSVDDCSAEPVSRDELLTILATPPKPGSGIHVGNTIIDEPTLDELNHLLRSWETCSSFGLPWQAAAYESDQFIREQVYGDPRISNAFSVSTLNELLDAREQIAADRIEQGLLGDIDVLMILATSDAVITPDSAPVRSIEADVVWVSPQTGTVNNGPTLVEFVYEDGGWKLRNLMVSSTIGF